MFKNQQPHLNCEQKNKQWIKVHLQSIKQPFKFHSGGIYENQIVEERFVKNKSRTYNNSWSKGDLEGKFGK